MRSVALMRTAKIGYIVISAVMCAFGILLAVHPELSASVIGVICGIVLIVFGTVKLTGFFSKDLYRLAFQYDLAFGILLMALGIIMLARPGNVMNFICVTLGFSILADGLFKIQIAVESKKIWDRNMVADSCVGRCSRCVRTAPCSTAYRKRSYFSGIAGAYIAG